MTIRETSEDLNISYGSVQNILTTDLNVRRVSAKFVPRVLTVEQKQQRLSVSLALRDRAASDSRFSGNVITGDEIWVCGYDPETRVQSSQWKSPISQCKSPSSQCKSPSSQWKSPSSQFKSPSSRWKSPSSRCKSPSSQWKSPSSPCAKKARQSRSNIKVIIVFFDLDGIVRAEFVPRNTTVNPEYYKGLLERLRNDVRRKRTEKWANCFILHHDNAPCHTPLPVRQFLSNKNITVCPDPPYSPDQGTVRLLALPQSQNDHER